MIRLRFSEHHAKAGKASAAARWGGEFALEEWNVDPLLLPDYDGFLRLLVAVHGVAYLCRPDGKPLDGVPDTAFVPRPARPVHTPKVTGRQLPKGVYTGSGYDDTHLEQKPEKQGRGEKRTNGSVLLTEIVKALRLRPMTLQEICDATGIRRDTVKNALWRFKGTHFRKVGGQRWAEVATA